MHQAQVFVAGLQVQAQTQPVEHALPCAFRLGGEALVRQPTAQPRGPARARPRCAAIAIGPSDAGSPSSEAPPCVRRHPHQATLFHCTGRTPTRICPGTG